MARKNLTIADVERQGGGTPTSDRLAKAPHSVVETRNGERAILIADDSRLGLYGRQNAITARQYQAGSDLRSLFALAYGSGMRAQSFDPPISGGANDLPDAIVAAKQRIHLAVERLGPDYFSVLQAVLWQDIGASQWAAMRGVHPSAGMPMLLGALTLWANYLRLPD